MSEQILTLAPAGKSGTLMPLDIYEQLKEAIVEHFLFQPEMTEEEILHNLAKHPVASVHIEAWFKPMLPDMVARDYLEVVENSQPPAYRLKLIRC